MVAWWSRCNRWSLVDWLTSDIWIGDWRAGKIFICRSIRHNYVVHPGGELFIWRKTHQKKYGCRHCTNQALLEVKRAYQPTGTRMRIASIRSSCTGNINRAGLVPFCLRFAIRLLYISGVYFWFVCAVKIDLISMVKEASAILRKRPTPICGFDLNNHEFAAIGNVPEMWGTCMYFFLHLSMREA